MVGLAFSPGEGNAGVRGRRGTGPQSVLGIPRDLCWGALEGDGKTEEAYAVVRAVTDEV